MPVLQVSETLSQTIGAIQNFTTEIEDLNKKIRELKDEILRLEGCKILLESYERVGIEDIIPQEEQFEYFKKLTNNFTLKKDPRGRFHGQDEDNPREIIHDHSECDHDNNYCKAKELYPDGDEEIIHDHSECDHDNNYCKAKEAYPDRDNHSHGHGHGKVNGENVSDMIRHLIPNM